MTRHALVLITMAALAVPTLSGCLRDRYAPGTGWDGYEEWEPPPATMPEPYNDGTLIVDQGLQAGDMGDILGYAGTALASNATYYGTGASIRLDSVGDGWWVMSYLNIGNLDIVNAPAGTYRTVSGEWSENDPQASVTGCSGPTYGNYTYDAGSQETEITITDNEDGSRTLEFVATFHAYARGVQEARGRLVYREGEVAPPPSSYGTPIVTSDLEQEGDMGEIVGFSGAATASGEYYGSSSSIRLDSIGEGWWVMSAIYVDGLDLRTAPAGTYRATSGTWTEGEPSINVTGCSGPSYGNYTYDAGAQETEITITDREDGSRALELVAQYVYGEATQVVRTRLAYRIDDAATTTF